VNFIHDVATQCNEALLYTRVDAFRRGPIGVHADAREGTKDNKEGANRRGDALTGVTRVRRNIFIVRIN
jgi:hypothetical protein